MKTVEQFSESLSKAIEGELLTHLNFTGDNVKDLVESQNIIRHMIMTMCGSLTQGVLK